MAEDPGQVIGYSGFEPLEELYEYHENACFIADTEASAHRLMRLCHPSGRYRVESVALEQIMSDYGCSCGEFAMELQAFSRFKATAEDAGIQFDSRAEEGCDVPLVVVQVCGVSISDD